jgi:hypothetical protein
MASVTSTLNSVASSAFGSSNGNFSAQFLGTKLILTGPQNNVDTIRRMLAQWIDIPYSQVKLDFYTFQGVSSSYHDGQREQVLSSMQKLHEGLAMAKAAQSLVKNALLANLRVYGKSSFNFGDSQFALNTQILNTEKLFTLAGFSPEPNRSHTLAEAVVLISFLKEADRTALMANTMNQAQDAFAELFPECERERKLECTPKGRIAPPPNDIRALYDLIHDKLCPAALDRFRHCYHFGQGMDYEDGQVVVRFFKYWLLGLELDDLRSSFLAGMVPGYVSDAAQLLTGSAPGEKPVMDASELERELYSYDIPAQLTQASSAADSALKEGVELFADDLGAVTVDQFLDWARRPSQDRSETCGLGFAGKAEMVVTSGQGVSLGTQGQASLPYQALPQGLANALATLGTIYSSGSTAAGSTGTPPAGGSSSNGPSNSGGISINVSGGTPAAPSSPASIGGSITPTTIAAAGGAYAFAKTSSLWEAIALSAGLMAPQPQFTTVTSSISIGVRPSVLKDGESARLQLLLNVGLTPNTTGPGYNQYDFSPSQALTTDVNVDALDCFDLASTNLQVSGPGLFTWQIPWFSDLPLVGGLAHGRTRNEVKTFDTMILVNVTVLPRSLDTMTNFFH